MTLVLWCYDHNIIASLFPVLLCCCINAGFRLGSCRSLFSLNSILAENVFSRNEYTSPWRKVVFLHEYCTLHLGLFSVCSGPFSVCVGLFSVCVGLFSVYVGLFLYVYVSFLYVYSRLQIAWHRTLRWFLKRFNLVPGVPGFSCDLSLVPCYNLVLIVNPMGRTLVRWKRFRNNLKILCHPICNRLSFSFSYEKVSFLCV